MFNHLAQGVEFSLTGHPKELPRLIRMTAGKIASKVYKFRGQMSHMLNKPIQGELIGDVTAANGMDGLRRALEQFRDHVGVRRTNYANGPLAKDQFALAQMFHIENQLEEVWYR